MNYEMIWFVILVIGALCLIAGVLLGSNLRKDIHTDDVGDLVIVPGEANEPPYIFLELAVTPDTLARNEFAVLRVSKVETREKQGV